MFTPLLAVAPATLSWSPKVALVMVVCNVIAIGIGKATIQHQDVGLKLPGASFFGGMGHGSMLACTSLGHMIGIGAIQGLAARGVLYIVLDESGWLRQQSCLSRLKLSQLKRLQLVIFLRV